MPDRPQTIRFRDFIVPQAIVPELAATDRNGAIRELVEALAGSGAIPASIVDELVTGLLERERSATTGFGKGVAVPHVKHAKVKRMVATIGRSSAGIDFAALDRQRVHGIVLLLSPLSAAQQQAQTQQHLLAMNIIFSNLQRDMFRSFLRQAATREAILDLLEEADQGK